MNDIFDNDEAFLQSEITRIRAEEKEIEKTKKRFGAIGLIWVNKECAGEELDGLLSNVGDRKEILGVLSLAQWHYMDVVGITESGLFNAAQLNKIRLEHPCLLKCQDGLPVFEEDRCVVFMSQNYGLSLPLCAAYVLSDAWR